MSDRKIYKVKTENTYSGSRREVIVYAVDSETATFGAGVTHDEVVTIEQISPMDLGFGALKLKKLPTSKELAEFYEGIVECLNIGTGMVDSMGIVSMQQSSPYFRGVIGEMIRDLRGGKILSDTMGQFPDVFHESTIAIIRAGETNGDLKPVLLSLATYEKRASIIQGKLKGGMTYPIIVAVMAFLCVMFVSLKLLPELAKQYEAFGAKLPMATRICLGFSDLVRHQPLFWVVLVGCLIYFYVKRREILGSRFVADMMIKFPIIGPLYRKMLIARMFRVLAMLLNNGTRIGRAFEISAIATGHHQIRDALLNTGQRVIAGDNLYVAFSYNQSIFGKEAPKILAFLRLASHTGDAAPILTRMADAAENEVEGQAEIVNKLMEPIMMGFLSVVVGGILFAVYYPMFNLGQVVLKGSK